MLFQSYIYFKKNSLLTVLGDFIIYKKLGLNTAKAVGLNVFAAMVSFVGVFIGLALATRTAAADWILCLVTGLFIYIPLVHVVSEFESHFIYTLGLMHRNQPTVKWSSTIVTVSTLKDLKCT